MQQTPLEMKVKSESVPEYVVKPTTRRTKAEKLSYEDSVIAEALSILAKRMKQVGPMFHSPQAVRNYLRLKMCELEHEVFAVTFLDSQHGVIAHEEMFKGTVNQTSVYPREVVKKALTLNASAVILSHNHPSGITSPSRADESLTKVIKESLALIDVRVLDHFIVGSPTSEPYSFAENGLI